MNAWCVVVLEKLIPIGPRSCMEISSSGRVVLFNQTIQVGTDGMAWHGMVDSTKWMQENKKANSVLYFVLVSLTALQLS
jgi:hypothetical protein